MSGKNEYVTLSVSDGTSMQAYISRPAGAARGGLIVFQEAFGVNAHIRNVADRFAKEGYLCYRAGCSIARRRVWKPDIRFPLSRRICRPSPLTAWKPTSRDVRLAQG